MVKVKNIKTNIYKWTGEVVPPANNFCTNPTDLLEEKGDNGFGYDPIFISSIFQKTNAQLKDEEKDSISHRGLAIKKITPLLEKMLI